MDNITSFNGIAKLFFLALFSAVVLGGFYLAGKVIEIRPPTPRPSITVSEEAKLFAKPDTAQLTLGVQTGRMARADQVMDTLAKNMDAVIKQMIASGIAEKDIKTTGLSLLPAYDWNDGMQIARGFEASEIVIITIRDLTKIGSIISDTTRVGANTVQGVRFYIEDETTLRKGIRAEAIAKAKADAETLAAEIGKDLGPLTGYGEGGFYPMFSNNTSISKDAEVNVPVFAGEQELVMNVVLTYELR